MTQARCEQCGEPVQAGALFCSKCGVDVSSVMPALEDTIPLTAASSEPVAPVRTTMRQALREATLGEYEIMNELGRGGMATVFLAHDISLDRKVAIKVMAPHLLEGEGMAERFKLEARTAAQLSHPHIIPIYAVKETADTLFFVMKYIEGRALDDIIRKSGQLPIPMVKDILVKVGSALGYAHRRDVVHRDIKPGNVMIDDEGTPIVTDFGIAKVAATSGLTMTGTTIGTPSYMSPEQCEAKEVTGASDQYSLGIVAFQMLTGTLPFEGDSAVSTMYKQCHDPLPPLRDFRPDCPTEIVETITRMLEKKPSDRWPTMEAAVQRLSADTGAGLAAARSQLIAAARESGDQELVARLSDPSLSKTEVSESTTGGRAAARPAAGSGRLAAAAAVVVLVGAGALGVLRPWEGGAPAELDGAGTQSGLEAPAQGDDGGPVDPSTLVAEGPGGPEAGADDGGPDSTGGAQADDGGGPAAGTPGDRGEPASGRGPSPAGGGGEPAAGSADPAVLRPPPVTQPVRRRYVVASVGISDAPDALEPGQSASLGADAFDGTGAAIPAAVIDDCQEHGWTRCGVTWTSGDPSVIRVIDGRLTALRPGRATVTATIAGVNESIDLVVGEHAVQSVAIEPGSLVVDQGSSGTLTATLLARDGSTLTGRPVSWRSSDPGVADVSGGTVRGVAAGTATVTASAEGAEASVRVEVLPDARTAAEGLVQEYARAFESGDLARVRALIPTLSPDFVSALEQSFGVMRQIRAELVVQDFQETGERATAMVGGRYTFVDDDRNAQTLTLQRPFTFQLQRTADGWRIADIIPPR